MDLAQISRSFDHAASCTKANKLDEAETIYKGLVEQLSGARGEEGDLLNSARIGLASVWLRGKKNQDEAIELCNACLELDPGDTKALFRRGMIWQELARLGRPGALENAETDVKEVLRLEPSNNRARQLLNHNKTLAAQTANLAAQAKENTEAVEHIVAMGFSEDLARAALKACKNNQEHAVGWLLTKQARQDEKEKDLESSGTAASTSPVLADSVDLGFGIIRIGAGVWREQREEWLGHEPTEIASNGAVPSRDPEPYEVAKLRQVLEADRRPYPDLNKPLPLNTVARTMKEMWPDIDREDLEVPIGPQPIVSTGLAVNAEADDQYIFADMY
eukprot:gnl/MRDRNA2_/MRDRNA2_27297_c0_seq1.p1 gnl/MRDRNA2_/MRDRNA2_27297_c0~~gnl/MRDRNA2_/MRDRNA2_27297_c0_seq1.p1  ORF type:complete len:333 (-),score=75.08 gnl/MRDRNA2_/MRDRNA2_27297_c0_seq1:90-1088(-)